MNVELGITVSVITLSASLCVFMLCRKQESLISPIFLYLLFYAFVFVVRPLLLDGSGSAPVYTYMRYQPTDADVAQTYVVSSFATITFLAGALYAKLRAVRHFGKPPPNWAMIEIDPRSLTVVWATLGTVALYSALFVGGDVFSGTSNIQMERVGNVTINVNTSGYILDAQFMLVGLCILLVSVTNFSKYAVAVLLAFFLYRVLIGWGRWTIILTAFAVYALYLIARGRRWPGAPALATGIVILALFSVIGQDREFFRSMFFTGSGNSSGGSYQYLGFAETAKEALSGLDFANFEYLTYILRTVPDLTETFTFGLQHLQIFTEPIPRTLWPGKPAGAPITFFDLNDYGNFFGLTNSLIGDGWMSGGYAGVAITFLLTGFWLEYWHQFFLRHKNRQVVVLLYVSTAALLFQLFRDGSIVAIAKFWSFSCLPIVAALLLAKRRQS